MSLKISIRNQLRALIQGHGPEFAKRSLWNHEFSSGRWDFLDRTGDERIQATLEKYARHGHILDLGCGSGTVSLDLEPKTYSSYTGIDISDVAIQKARERAQNAGRADCNEYHQSDITTYVPSRRYQVIIFGDSIYYFQHSLIDRILKRYSSYLECDGVVVVRIHDESGKHNHILECIANNFQVVERDIRVMDKATVTLIVFQPNSTINSLGSGSFAAHR